MDTEGIVELLRETAAEVVVPRFRQLSAGDIEEKQPGDFVTVADREAEVYLTGLLRAVYPSAVIIGEEGGVRRPDPARGACGAPSTRSSSIPSTGRATSSRDATSTASCSPRCAAA